MGGQDSRDTGSMLSPTQSGSSSWEPSPMLPLGRGRYHCTASCFSSGRTQPTWIRTTPSTIPLAETHGAGSRGGSQSRGRRFDSGKNSKTESSNLHIFEQQWSSSKGTKLLFQDINAIINQREISRLNRESCRFPRNYAGIYHCVILVAPKRVRKIDQSIKFGTSEHTVLTFGLSPVIKLGHRHLRKRERIITKSYVINRGLTAS